MSILKLILNILFIIGMFKLSYEDYKYRNISLLWIIIMFFISGAIAITNLMIKNRDGFSFLCSISIGLVLLIASLISHQLGVADGMVFIQIGLITGLENCCRIIFLSSLLLVIISVFLLCLKRVSLKEKLPFIPFILVAHLIVFVLNIDTF